MQDLGNIYVEQAESLPRTATRRYLPRSPAVRSARNWSKVLEDEPDADRSRRRSFRGSGDRRRPSNYYRQQGKKVGLIWIDAHADMNTPDSSPTGNVHGMPLACCIGTVRRN